MSTATAPQPPVAAPAAVTPVAPKPDLPISSLTQKPISEAAHNLFKMLSENTQPDTPAPAKEESAPVAPAVEPVAPVADADKPIKVAKKTPKRPDLPVPAAAPATPAAPVAPSEPVANWKESLLDEEKAALEDAEVAERLDPKHRGLADKMGKFFRAQQEFLKKNPTPEDDDPEWKKVLAMQPQLGANERRAIMEARIEERVSKKSAPKLEALEHELFVRDTAPKIEEEGNQIRRQLAHSALPKEMVDLFKEKGLPELQKHYGDELEVAGAIINTVVDDAKELLRITSQNPATKRAVGDVANDESHPKWVQHQRIAKMVDEVCSDFQKAAPHTDQVRDGKWFVTRNEWAQIPAHERSKFWTFTNSPEHVREMIGHAMKWVPGAVEANLKSRQADMERRGYKRVREAAPVSPPTAPPVATSSATTPRAAPAPAPASTPAGKVTPGSLLAQRLAGGS